ncbi:Ribokinase [Acidisarcina polymorpha]|uniref:Ribokinase n=1 Tax=Acidisarcina polymorpha TaxID=2211140 RepID=A0A2Z5G6H3_9BACT|nr:Ribokinase [Acidisarcina polymorpha]
MVVGSINSDLVVGAERIPRPGETILGDSFAVFPGGKGANQAVAVAKLGYPCSMIGKLGRDSFGADLRSRLVEAGVDAAAVGEAEGPSGVALITREASGENSIVVVSGANALVSPSDIDAHRELILSAALVLVQLETPLDAVGALGEIAFRGGVPLMLDPAPAQSLPRELLKQLAWITPNTTEAEILLGASIDGFSLERARSRAEALLERGIRGVVLKMGEDGVYLATAGGIRAHVPAFAVKACDTTAAGDAFNGGFGVALSEGLEPVAAARFASAVAAISVTRQGAQPSMPTRAEVDAFLLRW